jgi:hypothetical protein
LFQHGAAFAVLQHARDDVVSLAVLVANADELRALGGGAVGPKVFGEALAREINDAVGGGEDRLRRAIISVKRDDRSFGLITPNVRSNINYYKPWICLSKARSRSSLAPAPASD